MSWPVIIAIMFGAALAIGLTVGALQSVFGFRVGGAAVGAGTGVVGALLVARRRAALTAQANPPEQP